MRFNRVRYTRPERCISCIQWRKLAARGGVELRIEHIVVAEPESEVGRCQILPGPRDGLFEQVDAEIGSDGCLRLQQELPRHAPASAAEIKDASVILRRHFPSRRPDRHPDCRRSNPQSARPVSGGAGEGTECLLLSLACDAKRRASTGSLSIHSRTEMLFPAPWQGPFYKESLHGAVTPTLKPALRLPPKGSSPMRNAVCYRACLVKRSVSPSVFKILTLCSSAVRPWLSSFSPAPLCQTHHRAPHRTQSGIAFRRQIVVFFVTHLSGKILYPGEISSRDSLDVGIAIRRQRAGRL